jgi:hypothetical protein
MCGDILFGFEDVKGFLSVNPSPQKAQMKENSKI